MAWAKYGTLEQLRQARLIRYDYGSDRYNRRYIVVLTGEPENDEKRFFLYATPKSYFSRSSWEFVPFYSLYWSLHNMSSRCPAAATLAATETGEIKVRDLGESRPVTREEVESW